MDPLSASQITAGHVSTGPLRCKPVRTADGICRSRGFNTQENFVRIGESAIQYNRSRIKVRWRWRSVADDTCDGALTRARFDPGFESDLTGNIQSLRMINADKLLYSVQGNS